MEPIDTQLRPFYEQLLAVLRRPVVRSGEWRLLECRPAWDGNGSWDDFLAFAWHDAAGERLLVTANYAPHRGQCYVRLPFADLRGATWVLDDLMGDARYERDGGDLEERGLYLDVAPWNAAVFSLTRRA